ncbi:MAG: hypothetical protein KA116_01905 [Proteobacteria bacterium]|nr:hypothetical protein [Pseudomonadota bacterium]
MLHRFFRISGSAYIFAASISTWAVGFYRLPCEEEDLTKKKAEAGLSECIEANYSENLELIQNKCKEAIEAEIQSASKFKNCQIESNPLSKK